MDCVNCECTVKTMDNLESAIRALLQRGKRVNKMMDNEKAIREAKRREQVDELKKSIPKASEMVEEHTAPSSPFEKKSKVFNKEIGAAEYVNFDIPSLTYESSTTPYTSASLSIPKKTCPSSMYRKVTTSTQLTTSVASASTLKSKHGSLFLDEHYVVDREGRSEILPLKVLVKQRGDGSLDVHFAFLDEHDEKVLSLSMNIHEKKTRNVQVEGKSVQPDDK